LSAQLTGYGRVTPGWWCSPTDIRRSLYGCAGSIDNFATTCGKSLHGAQRRR